MSINLFPSRFVARLGYTYLRLKDNHMEILNKDDEIERLVAVTPQEMKRVILWSDISCLERGGSRIVFHVQHALETSGVGGWF